MSYTEWSIQARSDVKWITNYEDHRFAALNSLLLSLCAIFLGTLFSETVYFHCCPPGYNSGIRLLSCDSEKPSPSIPASYLKMEVAGSSEIQVITDQTIWWHNPEGYGIHSHRRENVTLGLYSSLKTESQFQRQYKTRGNIYSFFYIGFEVFVVVTMKSSICCDGRRGADKSLAFPIFLFAAQLKEFFSGGLKKLEQRSHKCVELRGEYVE
jgi:hypothetical protein